ncbi:MAG: MFS transporter [Myxococcota bacterium]
MSGTARSRRPFMGWTMVALAFALYGLGMAPAYYAWGFLAPEIIADLHLSREQVGNGFGLFTLTFAVTSPLAGWAIDRVGLRPVVALGTAIGTVGFAWTSVATTANEAIVAYALLGGLGIGLSTLLPVQTLAIRWFRRFRALATGIILLGAGVVGAFVPAVAGWIVGFADWRFAFQIVAIVFFAIGLLSALLLRDRPEDLGLLPDGASAPIPSGAPEPTTTGPDLAPRRALLAPQFLFASLACLTNTVPWRVVTAHGRLHLEDLGFAATAAAGILGLRVGLSGAGRLCGGAADLIDPRFVLASALGITASGLVGFAGATDPTLAAACVGLLGLGYGVAMTCEPIVMARLFGVRAFLGSNGVRIAITGVAGWLAPRWAGAAADRLGSYEGSFLLLAGLSVAGALTIVLCHPPKADP